MSGDDLAIQLFIAATAVTIAAIAVTQAGWTHRIFVWSMFLLAAALALAALFWQKLAPLMPAVNAALAYSSESPVAWLILGVVLGLLGGAFLAKRRNVSESPGKTDTHLRLQFNTGTVLPLAVSENNIWRWYSFAHIFIGKDQGKEFRHKTWTIFLVFDKPIAAKQVKIDGGGAVLPIYEVKDYGNRHAIIFFENDLSGLILDIQLVT